MQGTYTSGEETGSSFAWCCLEFEDVTKTSILQDRHRSLFTVTLANAPEAGPWLCSRRKKKFWARLGLWFRDSVEKLSYPWNHSSRHSSFSFRGWHFRLTHDLLVLLNVIAGVSEKAGQLVRLIYVIWLVETTMVSRSRSCTTFMVSTVSSGLHFWITFGHAFKDSSLLKHKTTRPMFDGFPQLTPQI